MQSKSFLDKSESSLPIVNTAGAELRPRSRKWQSRLIHFYRIAIFVAIVWSIRGVHYQNTAGIVERNHAPKLSVAEIQSILPNAVRLSAWQSNQMAVVYDKEDRAIGFVLHTKVESQSVIGYVGSTELAIVFGQADNVAEQVAGVLVLSSEDTAEHIDAIRNDVVFLKAWNEADWDRAAVLEVDAVSGATLTSYAIVESLRRRLGNDAPSFKFPNEVTLEELTPYFKSATRFEENREYPLLFDIYASENGQLEDNFVGRFMRSSPTVENINGYQGPTDFLVLFDDQGLFKKIVIRSSFDNLEPEPYVNYVRDDDYFTIDMFAGLDRRQLAGFDDDEFEGVSGATMTSGGIYRAMKILAQQSLIPKMIEGARSSKRWRFSIRDLGTLSVLSIAMLMTFTRLSRSKRLRTVFQFLLVVYFGFLNGDLISQVLVMGWSQNGVPLQNGIGILILTISAFCIPLFTKRNIYCHQICPFGAAQQLVRKVAKPRHRLPLNLHSVMRLVPGCLLLLIVIATLLQWNWNLAALEPFDAFSFRIAGVSAITIAIVGLVASFRYPMAYCKYGCPTGSAIEFIRSKSSARLGLRDIAGVGLFLLAMIVLQF